MINGDINVENNIIIDSKTSIFTKLRNIASKYAKSNSIQWKNRTATKAKLIKKYIKSSTLENQKNFHKINFALDGDFDNINNIVFLVSSEYKR